MAKGFNPNPRPGRVYTSLISQIKLLINNFEEDDKQIPVFKTTNKRFEILRQVVNDFAPTRKDLYFQVFSEENLCVITKQIPLDKTFSYAWVEQSEISGKWLVMASPPGAIRYDCLTVWKSEEDARQVASDILERITNFPLDDWDKKNESKYYRNFLEELPFDEDSITGLITESRVVNFDVNTQEKIRPLFDKLVKGEITKEKFQFYLNKYVNEETLDECN